MRLFIYSRLGNLALVYRSLGDYDKAIDTHKRSITIARDINDKPGLVQAFYYLGMAYAEQGEYENASDAQQQSLNYAVDIRDRRSEGRALSQLGLAEEGLGNYEKAIGYHQKSIAVAVASQDRRGEGEFLGNLGLTYRALSQHLQAIAQHQKSLAIAVEFKDKRSEGRALSNIGEEYEFISQYSKAIEYHEKSLAIARATQERRIEAESLGNLGVAYRSLGDYKKAIQYHEQSLALTREIKDRRGEGNALGNLGMDYYALNDYKKAIDYHEQRLAIAIEIKDEVGRGNAMSNLGNAYRSIGKYDQAEKYHQKRLEIAIATKDRRAEGQALGFLGLVYRSLGKHDKAIEYSEKGLEIAKAIQDGQGECRSLGYLGSAYYAKSQANRRSNPELSRQDYDRAIEYHQKSLAKAIEINDRRSQGKSYGYLGAAYESRGNYAEAIKNHEQSLVFAREVNDRRGEGNTLSSLGLAYAASGKPDIAVEYHRKSIALRQAINDRFGEGSSWKNLGISLLKQNNLTESESALRNAISLWESLRTGLGDSNKISLAETQASAYPLLQEILVRQNRPEAALEVAESGRARAFAELLALKLRDRGAIDVQNMAKAPNLSEIRAIAKQQNATLVEYSIINADTLYIWVIKPNGDITFRPTALDRKTPMAQLISIGRESLTRSGAKRSDLESKPTKPTKPVGQAADQNPDLTMMLTQLHRTLIAPIAADLPTDPNQQVIFLPQSELFLVPFPALQDASGKFLIQQHTVSTAPSIQTLQLTHEKAKRANRSGQSLVVGNPTMPIFQNQQLNDLPGSREEAIAISKLLNATPLLGDQATKPAVLEQMSRASIIHLATHGLPDTLKGDIPGAIALAPSPKDNGLLSASEIFDLSLTADLAVLSACDTGRGEITGDGVVGLSRSLIAAGVPSVVVSLWAVSDESTSVLMGHFYQGLQTNPNKAQALRTAMLATLKQYPNPNDWAAFTLIGESDRESVSITAK